MNTIIWLTGIWWLIAAVLLCLLLYRKYVEQYEDDFLHLSAGDVQQVRKQARTSQQLNVLDRWVRILSVVVIAYGICLAAFYLMGAWEKTMRITD